jgi:hypothetical protein
MRVYMIVKCAIHNVFEYLDSDCAFALDNLNDLSHFKEELYALKSLDNSAEIYAVSYSVEKMIYSDNILIKTHLAKENIQEIFAKYREIEPYYIEIITDDEIDDIDIDNKETFF